MTGKSVGREGGKIQEDTRDYNTMLLVTLVVSKKRASSLHDR